VPNLISWWSRSILADWQLVVFDDQRYVQDRLFHVNRNPGSDPFLIFDRNSLLGMLSASV
jgi:hypothetical protein